MSRFAVRERKRLQKNFPLAATLSLVAVYFGQQTLSISSQ
jgi:hypothetical protein